MGLVQWGRKWLYDLLTTTPDNLALDNLLSLKLSRVNNCIETFSGTFQNNITRPIFILQHMRHHFKHSNCPLNKHILIRQTRSLGPTSYVFELTVQFRLVRYKKHVCKIHLPRLDQSVAISSVATGGIEWHTHYSLTLDLMSTSSSYFLLEKLYDLTGITITRRRC